MYWKKFSWKVCGVMYHLSYVKNYSRINRKYRQFDRILIKAKFRDIPKFRAVMYSRAVRVVLLRKYYKTRKLLLKE